MHLLAFSTRMKVCMELSSLPIFTADRKRDFLHKALHDEKISMNSNLSAQWLKFVRDLLNFQKFTCMDQKLFQTPNISMKHLII